MCVMMMMMKILPVFVDEGVEGHPVSPAGAEVVDVDVGIPGQEQEVTARQVLFTSQHKLLLLFSPALV